MRDKPGWTEKYVVAVHGLWISLREQSSFWIHLPIAAIVVTLAAAMQLDAWRVAVLVCMITIVLSAEMMNTAIERLVKRLHPEHDAQIGAALDTAAAAVLIAAIGAACVGVIVLGPPLWELLRGQ